MQGVKTSYLKIYLLWFTIKYGQKQIIVLNKKFKTIENLIAQSKILDTNSSISNIINKLLFPSIVIDPLLFGLYFYTKEINDDLIK